MVGAVTRRTNPGSVSLGSPGGGLAVNGVWRLFRAPRVSCMGSPGSAAQAKGHRGTGCGGT